MQKPVRKRESGKKPPIVEIIGETGGEVVLIDPPTSHKDGPIFLNVLRVLDIPEALGMLAPDVKLTIINGKDKAFDRTEQLYKLAGAEDKFNRK